MRHELSKADYTVVLGALSCSHDRYKADFYIHFAAQILDIKEDHKAFKLLKTASRSQDIESYLSKMGVKINASLTTEYHKQAKQQLESMQIKH